MRNRRNRLVLAAVLACTTGTAAHADAGPAQTAPTLVRVTASGQRWTGELVSLDATTLSLRTRGDAAVEAIPLSSISSIEQRVRPGRKRRGLGIGLLAGALVGAVAGYAAGDDCSRGGHIVCFDRPATAAAGAVGFGVIGMAIGALVAPAEKWEATTRDGLRR